MHYKDEDDDFYEQYVTKTQTSPLGHPRCSSCRDNPAYRLLPCGHDVCCNHAIQVSEGTPICGRCDTVVEHKGVLQPTTPTTPTQSVDDPEKTPTPSLAQLAIMPGTNSGSGLGSGIGPGMGSNGFKMKTGRDFSQPMTPTHGTRFRTYDGGDHLKLVEKYVPPQLRPDPIARPSSTSSTSSFMSQIPTENTRFDSPSSYDPFSSSPESTPNFYGGRYRAGPAQLPQRLSQMSLYDGPQDRTPPPNPYKDRVLRAAPVKNDMRGVRFPQPGDNHAMRAASIASMITAGMMDDPNSPDWGDPGAPRRVSAPPTPRSMRIKSGDIVAAAGQGNTPGRNNSKEEPNIFGNAVIYINVKKINLPKWFPALAQGYTPTLEEVLEYVPIIDPCMTVKPSTAGVVHIKNIPYNTSRAEIIALLGRQAKICPQPPGTSFHAVHIIMERQSGKTLDAFVEVESGREAQTVVTQINNRARNGRPAKLGDRCIEVAMSNRDEMLATIFPCAKNVTWIDGVPKIETEVEELYPGVKSTGFIGFLQDEEITHMSKHADTPQRSPFAQRCLIRTYECLITTLHKYPWPAYRHVLESERKALFDCTKLSVRALVNMLSKTHSNHRGEVTKPTPETLRELAVAALTCPGFSEQEKAQIAADLRGSGYHQLTRPNGMNIVFGGTHPWAEDWPFKIAAKEPGVSDEIMEYFASLMRDATNGVGMSMNDLFAGANSPNFGAVNIDYSRAVTRLQTLNIEAEAIQSLLSRVLPRGTASPSTASRKDSTVSTIS